MNDKRPRFKPFLKWAGGKTQLLEKLYDEMPESIKSSNEFPLYIEPFIGGGALFFFLKSMFDIDFSIIADINQDLITTYYVVQQHVDDLIVILEKIEKSYLESSPENRTDMYYKVRDRFNLRKDEFKNNITADIAIAHAADMIFLNRTCFNGLYRQNRKGHFNVPEGKYKNPKICQTDVLKDANNALENTRIVIGDFNDIFKYVNEQSFLYYDPPYRPLNRTSSFNSYSKHGFNDDDQKRLASFYRKVDKMGAYQMLSNSDPKSTDPRDDFFDDLFEGFNISRINARRMINSNADKRGSITELLITNY